MYSLDINREDYSLSYLDSQIISHDERRLQHQAVAQQIIARV